MKNKLSESANEALAWFGLFSAVTLFNLGAIIHISINGNAMSLAGVAVITSFVLSVIGSVAFVREYAGFSSVK